MNAPLVFLDIDGVLNDHLFDCMSLCGEIHNDKVRRLNRLLFATGAKVVLSSAWRYIMHRNEAKLQGLDWLLRSHGFHSGRLIGITEPDTLKRGIYNGNPGDWPIENERGKQIWRWITGEGWRYAQPSPRYVVIDDLDLGISDQDHPFVQTDGKVGLTDRDVVRAIEILRKGPK